MVTLIQTGRDTSQSLEKKSREMVEEGHRITEEILVQGIADVVGLTQDDGTQLNKRIQVADYKVSEGSAKGDNFACIMKAVSVEAAVDGQTKHFYFMSKEIPNNPFREMWVEKSNIFGKELAVYKVLLPALEQLTKKSSVQLGVPLCHGGSKETKLILMEDLKHKKYVMADKKKGLDVTHTKMVLGQLAALHAASYHWLHSDPAGIDKMKEEHATFFHDEHLLQPDEESRERFNLFLQQIFQGATAIVGKKDKDLGEKMTTYSEKMFEHLRDATKPRGFCVMCHGDCWTNNIMFLYDDDKTLKSMKMLDFQMTRYAMPSLDLVYFFVSSLEPAVRSAHLHDLLQFYHTTLTDHLAAFGHSPDLFTWEDLLAQYNDCFHFGLIFGVFVNQLVLAEKLTAEGGGFDMDNVTTEEEAERNMETFSEKLVEGEKHNTLLEDRLTAIAQEALDRGVLK